MRKFLVLSLLVLAIVGLALADGKPGGIARQLSMGGSNIDLYNNTAVNPYIWDDPSFVLLNPAFASMYGDYVTLNVAGGQVQGSNDYEYGHQYSAGNFAITKGITIGTIFSYDPSRAAEVARGLQDYLNQVGPRAPQGYRVPDVLEVLGSFDLGSMNIGVGVLYGASSSTAKTSNATASTDNELSSSVFAFRAGILADFTSSFALDANAFVRMSSATDNRKGSPNSFGEYSASGTEIGVLARLKMKLSSKVNFVPHAMFGTFTAEPTEDQFPSGGTALTTKVKATGTLFGLGVGAEVKTKTFYLAGGLAFRTQSLETKTSFAGPTPEAKETETLTGFPVINVGGEWWFLDWLAARGGYFRAWRTETNKNEQGPNSSETSTMRGWSNVAIGSYGDDFTNDNSLVTLGIGLRFGNFTLDAMVSEHALQRGLGLIGSSDNANTLGYATLSYNFAE